MSIKKCLVIGWFVAALLICFISTAFAFNETVADKPLWAIGGEVEIRFRTIVNYLADYSEDMIRSSIYRAPWGENLLYAGCEEYKPVTPEEAEIININEQKKEYTIIFHKPGRYQIVDIMMYILDPENETLVEIGKELNDAVEECKGKNEKETASLLRKWIVNRIQYGDDSSDYPERAQYDDPIGVLIGRKAICTGYAGLYQLLTEACGIWSKTLTVEVKRNKGGHVINMNRLDEEWSFTDVTWEDAGRKCKNQYFAMNEKKMKKYYSIPDYEDFYYNWFSSPEQIERLNNLLDL